MAEVEHPTREERQINWIAWALGIGGTLVTAMLLWIIQFLAFGFDSYVEDIANKAVKSGGVPQATITTIQGDITDIKATLETQAERDREFREQQREDMRNLTAIIMRRNSDGD